MNIDNWQFCPRCATELQSITADSAVIGVSCKACGFYKYDNPLPTTIALIADDQGRLLVLQRAQEPNKGMWDVPGGFLNGGETAEACMIREIREEIGCEVEAFEPIGTFASVYGDTGLRTIGVAHHVTLVPNAVITLSDENDAYDWVLSKDIVDKLAFEDVRSAVKTLL